MEYQDQVKIITDIEKNFPVNDLSYKNIKIWPVVRLEIWKNIFDGPIEPKRAAPRKSFIERSARFLNNRFLAKRNYYKKAETVFLIAPSERKAVIQGKYYSPFSNTLNDLLKESGVSSAVLDLGRRRLPVYGENYFIDREAVDSPILYKISKILKKYFPRQEEEIVGWDKFISYMEAGYSQYIPNRSSINNYCDNILRYENIFTRILKKIQPKIAFLVCYYHPAAMGYIKACRKLGIKSVDIQHGDHYGMYRDWSIVPAQGYELLPSSFWCWGKSSADKINEWSYPAHPEHKAFMGGNPWISKFIDSSKNVSQNQNIKVLVALTNVAYPVDNIADAIKDSPNNVNWIIRPHPAMPNELNKLSKTGRDFAVDGSPLVFESLKDVDFILTPCSTVAYEALLFKVHPIITHTDGKEKFSEYINKGLFSYADSGNKIIQILQRNKASYSFREEVPFMETDPGLIKDNLIRLIS